MKHISSWAFLPACIVLTGCCSTDRHEHWPARVESGPPPVVVATPQPQSHPAPSSEPWLDVTISSRERQIIQEYRYEPVSKNKKARKAKSLPPGLARKVAAGRSLPPGWEKKLEIGQVMPADVYAQSHPLPPDLVSVLPPPPPGTIIVAVQGKVVRLLEATRQILDVFDIDL